MGDGHLQCGHYEASCLAYSIPITEYFSLLFSYLDFTMLS